jgi:hypothetical protein
MLRVMFPPILTLWALAGLVWADEPQDASPPQTYELMINGESFLVQLDRQTKLASKDKSSAGYQVALRIASRQRVELNTLRFEYEWPANVSDDRRRPERTIRLRHELGYTMFLTDLGPGVESEDEAIKILRDSVNESLRASGCRNLKVSEPYQSKFAGCKGKGVTFRYQDQHDFDHTCVAYVLSGTDFAATCVFQYFDKDGTNAKPKIKATLDSVQAIRQKDPDR